MSAGSRYVHVTFTGMVSVGGQLQALFKVEDRAGLGKDALPASTIYVPLAGSDIAKLSDPRPIESIYLQNPPFGGFALVSLIRVDWWPIPYDMVIVGVEPWFGHVIQMDGITEYVVHVGLAKIGPTAYAAAIGSGAPADNLNGGIFTVGNGNLVSAWDDNILYGRNLDWLYTADVGKAWPASGFVASTPTSGAAGLAGPNVWRHLQNDEHNSAGSKITWPNEPLAPGSIRAKKGDLVALRTWVTTTNGYQIGSAGVQSGVHLFYQRGG